MAIYSGFSHSKRWFSWVFCMFTRPGFFHLKPLGFLVQCFTLEISGWITKIQRDLIPIIPYCENPNIGVESPVKNWIPKHPMSDSGCKSHENPWKHPNLSHIFLVVCLQYSDRALSENRVPKKNPLVNHHFPYEDSPIWLAGKSSIEVNHGFRDFWATAMTKNHREKPDLVIGKIPMISPWIPKKNPEKKYHSLLNENELIMANDD